MSVNESYRLTLKANFFAGQNLNVFFYTQTAGTGGADALGQVFEDDLLPLIEAVQSASVVYSSALIENLNDDGDFVDWGLAGEQGAVVGDYLPGFACWTFKYLRATRAYRHGWKRFCGPVETWVTGGSLDPTHNTEMDALAAGLGTALTDGVNIWVPVLAHRVPNTTPQQYTFYGFTSVVYSRLGTQNSRKQ